MNDRKKRGRSSELNRSQHEKEGGTGTEVIQRKRSAGRSNAGWKKSAVRHPVRSEPDHAPCATDIHALLVCQYPFSFSAAPSMLSIL